MTDLKGGTEVGTIYLYADEQPTSRNRGSFLSFFKRKLGFSDDELEEKRQALVKKDGHYRVRYTGHLTGNRRKFLADLYVSLVDLKWRYALAVFFNVYLISFLFFAVMWWLMCYNHGDFDNVHNPSWEPCISAVRDFPSCMLFSIETQTTIGYGFAYPNTDCHGSLLLVYVQITIGLLLDNLLLGFVFVKFAQPKRRRKTLKFSKNACVCLQDGELVIQVRVGDIRKSHLLDAKVHGVMVKRHITEEGVLYPIYMHNLKFTADNMEDKIVLMWPLVLTHKITEESPFWNVKPADLSNEKYEIIVYLEGTIETTGEFCQSRTSFTPREMLWGHRFDRIEEFDTGNGRWEIDFAGFNDVVYVNNIRHSARELAAFKVTKTESPFNVPNYENEVKKDGQISTKQIPIQTVSLKTIPYDTAPDLPSREVKKAGKEHKWFRRHKKTKDALRSSRDSMASVEEKGYTTADDDLSNDELERAETPRQDRPYSSA